MNHTLDIFEERYQQAVEFPPQQQPQDWRTWEGELVERSISKDFAQAAFPHGQLFRFEETRPSEGYVQQVGRITPFGIYIILRNAQGLRAIVSRPLMEHVMGNISGSPEVDPIHYILLNM